MVAGGTQSRWALILAGGDGRRLRPLTRQIAGDDRPKQFCPVLGGETLLEQTRRRVAALAPSERVLVVVVRAHERFYAPLLADVPSRCVVIQPENRGTAPAILYGLLRLTAMTPVAPVALFPSDHYVSDDAAFIAHVEGATEAVRARPDLVVLLDRKSTRLNSSHITISYAVFCLKKKKSHSSPHSGPGWPRILSGSAQLPTSSRL